MDILRNPKGIFHIDTKSLLLIAMMPVAGLALTGCATPPISAIETVAEDRSAADIKTDTQIKAGILADINNRMGTVMAASLTVSIYEQNVMVTGKVESPAERAKVSDILGATGGLKKFYNEVQVIPEGTETENSAVDDVVVEQKFYGKLVTSAGVSHTNWRYDSVNGTLYLFGRALSKAEMNKVVAIAKDTTNVRKVVNYAFVRAVQ